MCVCVGGGYWFLFIVDFSLIKYWVCEIFDGYVVDGFHFIFYILYK